jgi:D-glycero-alpha-D-manno-heptose-7-phosphate kinase
LLDNNWRLKSKLGSLISSPEIEDLYERCRESGSLGGKLLGAGAGGFFLNVVPKPMQQRFQKEMSPAVHVNLKLSETGSRILLNIKND